MPQVTPLGLLRPFFTDKCGKLLVGGKVFTYEANSLTPKITYADSDGLMPNTNPVILDKSGEADIYLDGNYRFQIFNRFGVLIHDINNIRDHFKDQIQNFFTGNILAAGGLPDDSVADYNYLMQRLAKIAVDKGWDASFVTTASSQNQQQINDFGGAKWYAKAGGYELGATVKLENGDTVKSTEPANIVNPNLDKTGWILIGLNTVESIADLIDIQNPREGQVIEVKSYYAGEARGGGLFELRSGLVVDNKTSIIPGVAGSWYRVGWDSSTTATIYHAGIKADGTDETDRFDNLVAAAKGKRIYLMGKIVKTNGFRIGSGTAIINGGLDFSSSTIIQEAYRFYDGYIIGDNRPRNYNAEYHVNYASLEPIVNIEIKGVDFILPKNPVSAFRAIFLHKVYGFKFTRNKLLKTNGHTWIQIVGGHDDTSVTGISPDAYIETLKNGRCSDIEIHSNTIHGTQVKLSSGYYISHKLCHIVSTEDVFITKNKTKNITSAVAIDGFNRNCTVSKNRYEVDAATFNLFPEFDSADTFAYYVGQGSYDVNITHNYAKNYGRSGVYLEASKSVNVLYNKLYIDSSLVPAAGVSAAGIRIQSNHYAVSGDNKPEIGNVIDCKIVGNTVNSLQLGIAMDGVTANSHKDITISINTIKSYLSAHAILVANASELLVSSNKANGSLGVAAVSDSEFDGNSFANGTNYALYFYNNLIIDNSFTNNKFTCFSGSVIYNNSGAGSNIKLSGGGIFSRGGAASLKTDGLGAIEATGFDNGIPSFLKAFSETLTITPGSSKLFEVPCDGVKKGWFVNVKTDEMKNFYNNVQVDFNINAVCENDKIIVLVKNIGSGSNNATVYFSAMLSSYLNKQYLN